MQAAQQVEHAPCLHHFRHDWVLRLAPALQFLGVNPGLLPALHASGRLIWHSRSAQLLLQPQPGLVGRPLIGQPLLFMLAAPPPVHDAVPRMARWAIRAPNARDGDGPPH